MRRGKKKNRSKIILEVKKFEKKLFKVNIKNRSSLLTELLSEKTLIEQAFETKFLY
jgi:hypothetical protein